MFNMMQMQNPDIKNSSIHYIKNLLFEQVFYLYLINYNQTHLVAFNLE